MLLSDDSDRGPVWVKLLVVSSDRTPRIDPAPEHLAWPGAALSWQAAQVTDFTHKNLSGARFEDVNLTGADFHRVDLTGARFRVVDLTRVTISGSALRDMDISGQIENLRINGVKLVSPVGGAIDPRFSTPAITRLAVR